MSGVEPSKLKVAELRAELQARGLDTKGVKAVLVERLESALFAEAEEAEANENEPAEAEGDDNFEDDVVELAQEALPEAEQGFGDEFGIGFSGDQDGTSQEADDDLLQEGNNDNLQSVQVHDVGMDEDMDVSIMDLDTGENSQPDQAEVQEDGNQHTDEMTDNETEHGEAGSNYENEEGDTIRRIQGVGKVLEGRCFSTKKQRTRSFSKRRQTLINAVIMLHIETNAEVSIELTSEAGRCHKFSSIPCKPSQRSYAVQVGESALPCRQPTLRSTLNTPTKPKGNSSSQAKQTTPSISRPHATISSLPGKRKKVLTASAKKSTSKNKCFVCKLIYGSKKDNELKKQKGLQATWLGCDIKKCERWAHAACVGKKLKTKKDAENIPFVCANHK